MRRAGRSRVAVVAAAVIATSLAGCTSGSPQGVPSASAGDESGSAAASTAAAPSSSAAPSSVAPSSSASPSAAFDLQRYSVDDPSSIWVVVDKQRPLQPKSWVPQDLVAPDVPHTNAPQLRQPAAEALERMVAAAKEDGVGVVSLSAYRPYTVQRSIYLRNLHALGKVATEKLTARPGYSEHQTGLADDLGDSSGRCPIQTCFATTAAGKWLASNSWRYGFILRYPEGQQAVTGIQWEPWHFRFVGTALSTHMHETDQTLLEKVFDLPDSPDY